EPGVVQGTQVGGARGDGPTEFLGIGTTRVVHDRGIGGEQPQPRTVLGPIRGKTGGIGHRGLFTGTGGGGERIDTQVGDDPPVGYVRIGVCAQKGVGGVGVLATGGQHHGGQVQVHVGQYLAQV